ncbi:50S ribosomal protein L17 [Candidatus Similichlamydia laticola]|uniref:50S ribosomal protein L17 n=1 Tax=Candidatus Similichlamydia laticola TaxID=2170265 RepID=A0A369KD65_9BACT|nr:50S ribosomal protein L17 [Candidatus Similichlamydia laticola]RDB31400.1 LSU ribosomal protein L17p [Candidatus Similichlamydia laticola]
MRHRKQRYKLGRNSSHRRCLFANMLKALVVCGSIETTLSKAKALQPLADRLISLAKSGSLASRRRVASQLMLRYNKLSPKEARLARAGDLSVYNNDRRVLNALFSGLGARFLSRDGGYTRILKKGTRIGDCADVCVLEYLPE